MKLMMKMKSRLLGAVAAIALALAPAAVWAQAQTYFPSFPNVAYFVNTGTASFTMTNAQFLSAPVTEMIDAAALGAGQTITTPTAVSLIGALPLGMGVGSQWIFKAVNSSGAAQTVTLAGGTGVTFSGGLLALTQNLSTEFLCTIATSTTVTCQGIGSGL